mmetsp:Transcript_22994/g.54355  ORF Transcript_22994/g.54355 Transcript_22994/m.54355 type:complete len:104 (+) Transcript_22994:1973-2284(+)
MIRRFVYSQQVRAIRSSTSLAPWRAGAGGSYSTTTTTSTSSKHAILVDGHAIDGLYIYLRSFQKAEHNEMELKYSAVRGDDPAHHRTTKSNNELPTEAREDLI